MELTKWCDLSGDLNLFKHCLFRNAGAQNNLAVEDNGWLFPSVSHFQNDNRVKHEFGPNATGLENTNSITWIKCLEAWISKAARDQQVTAKLAGLRVWQWVHIKITASCLAICPGSDLALALETQEVVTIHSRLGLLTTWRPRPGLRAILQGK